MQNMQASGAYHMCSARLLPCGGCMQSMHTLATGAPTARQEGEASVPTRMASRSPMVATCQWGDVVRCLLGVPPDRCATALGDWQQTIAP